MKVYTIPPGEYVIENEKAYRLQSDIMTGVYGDNPYMKTFTHTFDYETAFDFSGAEDITVVAYGVTFLADGIMTILGINNCKNITIMGLTLDMKRRAYSRGRITAVGSGYFDVKFETDDWISPSMPAPRMVISDRKSGRFLHALSSEVVSGAVKKDIGGAIRFFYDIDGMYIGDDIYILHTWHTCPAVLIYEAENIRLIDVTIHSHAGIGIVGHLSKNILLKRVNIVPAASNAVSTNTDATHFCSCGGSLRYEDCRFEGSGDDAANIHGFYQTVTEVIDRDEGLYRLAVKVKSDIHSLRLDHPHEGDTLEFSYKRDIIPLERYRVLKLDLDKVNWGCIVKLDRPLPDNCAGNYLASADQLPKLDFIRCSVFNNVARGLLIRTRGVLVEDCRFESCLVDALHISAESYWNESAGSENVTVRGCVMTGCGLSVYAGADEKKVPLHRNITINGNVITAPVRISSVDGVIFEGNKTSGEVIIDGCVNVRADGNEDMSDNINALNCFITPETKLRLQNCGYKTAVTKLRLNRNIC